MTADTAYPASAMALGKGDASTKVAVPVAMTYDTGTSKYLPYAGATTSFRSGVVYHFA